MNYTLPIALILNIFFLIPTIKPAYAGGDWDKVGIIEFKIINPDLSEFEAKIVPKETGKTSMFPKDCKNILIYVSYSKIYSYFNFPNFVTFEKNAEAATELKKAMIDKTLINFGTMGTGLVYDKQKPCIVYSKALWESFDPQKGTKSILSFYNPI